MRKIYTYIGSLLCFILFMGIGQLGMSQTTTVEVTHNTPIFGNEESWELVDVNTNTVVACLDGPAVNTTETATITFGNTYELRTWESFGDAWSGTLEIVNPNTGEVILPETTPTSSGNGGTTCPGTPSTGFVVDFSFLLQVPIDCTPICPDDITAESEPGQCGAFVDVPAPTLEGSECEGSESTVLLDEGFDGGELPADWSVEADGLDASSEIGPCNDSIYSFDCTTLPYSAFPTLDPSFMGTFATIDDDVAGSTDDRDKSILTPVIDLSNNDGGDELSFSYHFNAIGTATFEVSVFDGSSFVTVFSANADETGVANIDISGYNNSDFQVKFTHVDNATWAWGIAIDNVVISEQTIIPGSTPTVLNDYNDTEDASDFYPVGETTVTFYLEDDLNQTCEMTITVEDVEAPVFDNCPQDQTITLDPGACDITYNFTPPTVTENCPGDAETVAGPYCSPCEDPSGGAALACAPFAQNSIIQYVDLPSDGFIEYFVFNQETFGDAPLATVNIYEGASGGPVPYTGGGFTPIFSIDYQTDAADDGSCVQVDFGQQVFVTGGVWVEVFTPGTTLNSRVVQTPETCDGNTATGMNTFIVAPACAFNTPQQFSDIGFPNFDASYALGFGSPVEAEQTDTPGFNEYEPGDILPRGTHCFQYEAVDNAGNSASCEWCVTVEEFPNPQNSLTCNDLVNVSLDNNCEAVINADALLEGGPYGCYEDFTVEVATDIDFNDIIGSGSEVILDGSYAGQTLYGRVTSENGNTCWGEILVEDKLIPELLCGQYTGTCDADNFPGSGGVEEAVLFESTDTNTITFATAIACPGGDYSYLRVIDMEALGISGEFTPETFRMGVESSSGGINATLRFYEFNDPSSYDPNAAGFAYADISQIGDDVTGTIPALTEEFWQMPVDGITIPAMKYVVVELQVPGGNFVDFVMGSNANGEDLPTYLASDFCGTPDPATLASVGFPANHWVMMVYGEASTLIPFPVPDSAIVTPPSGEGPFVVSNFDPCGDVTLSYEDEMVAQDCDSDFASIIYRNWTAVDESGNTSSCQDTLNVTRPDLSDADFPDNITLECDGPWDVDGDGYPDPEETGAPNTFVCDNLIYAFEDLRVDVCDGTYKIVREYTLIDWCTGETTNGTQLIKVLDDEGPDVECPADATISTGFYTCVADYSVPTPVIEDECSSAGGFTVESSAGNVVVFGPNTYVVEDLPIGTHQLTYTASDDCGNTATCVQNVTVEDDVPPVAVCDQNTKVALGLDGRAYLRWETIEDGSYDNCEIVKNEVIRMDRQNQFVCDELNVWSDRVWFCCEDIGETVQVLYRVTDASGNSNTCMVNVLVEDKVLPNLVAPPNITISCEYEYDVDDLSADFGRVANILLGETREDIIIDDPAIYDCAGFNGSGPINWGRDGFITDNCFVTVDVTEQVNIDDCGEGTIIRVFTGRDANGNQIPGVTAVQRISVEACDFFDRNDIDFPNDVLNVNACNNGGTGPDVMGRPQFGDDICGRIATSYEDEVFTVVDSACYKILRTWKVLDWCQYDENTGEGLWTDIQVIKVTDMDDPVVDDSPIEVCDTTDGCEGFASLIPEVTDECTPEEFLEYSYQIDAFNDGTIDITGNTKDASGVYPYGQHRLIYTVEDMCGNETTVEIIFTIEDCKKPTPVCFNGLATVTMPETGMVALTADYFDAGSFDNCTEAAGLQISYSSDVNDIERVFTCEDLDGQAENQVEIEMWVTDEAGNQQFCVTYLLLQDNDDACPDGSTGLVSGLVETEEGAGVPEAEVVLEAENSPTPRITVTDEEGSYGMVASLGNSYDLSSNKTDDILNGVTTWDLTLIQRHILGLQEITSPYDLIAADINRDGSVSGKDLTELRRVILGLDQEFRNNASWQMVDASENLPSGIVPQDYAQVIEIANLTGDLPNQDFTGVKIGDINGSVELNGLGSETRTASVMTLNIAEEVAKTGTQVSIEVRADEKMSLDGYQFTLGFDATAMQYAGVEAGVLSVNAGHIGAHRADEGLISTSWNTSASQAVEAGEVLFTVVFDVTRDVALSSALEVNSEITPAEAYLSGEKGGVDLRFEGTQSAEAFALYQNVPNPFDASTLIEYRLPKAGEATLTVYDMQGSIVYTRDIASDAGMNQITVKSSELGAAGVMYYTIESGEYTATKKMVVLK